MRHGTTRRHASRRDARRRGTPLVEAVTGGYEWVCNFRFWMQIRTPVCTIPCYPPPLRVAAGGDKDGGCNSRL